MPPSAMTGTSCAAAARAHSMIAVIIGTPMPATTRVVQIEPAPMPTFTASTPCSISAIGALGGRDVAGDEVDVGKALADPADHVEHALRVAVRGVDDEHVDAGGDERLGALHRVLARRRSPRRSAAGRASPSTRSDTSPPSGCP